MYLVFDTETTGRPHNKNAPLTDLNNWPRVVQLAWQLHDHKGKLLTQESHIIRPDGFDIPFNAEQIHGISTQLAMEKGKPLKEIVDLFEKSLEKATVLVGHNINFDINILGAELVRLNRSPDNFVSMKKADTTDLSLSYCALSGGPGGKFKMPKLIELHQKLFGEGFSQAHDAAFDVEATARSFFALIEKQIVPPFDDTPFSEIVYERPELKIEEKKEVKKEIQISEQVPLHDHTFFHLHVHSQFSVLQATPKLKELISLAKEMEMPAVAMTDLGNLFGAFQFVAEAHLHGIKPIVGCEVYVAEERKKTKFTKDNPDKRHTQVLLAKSKEGYRNLSKLVSLGYTEGLYGLHPRVDKELVQQYREGLIATTGGLNSEIPYLILNVGEHVAEGVFQWWHTVFGEDFYVELNRHSIPEDDRVNATLLKFAKKYNVRCFAANNCYYLSKKESKAHDILLCIKEGEKVATEIGFGHGKRFGFPNDEFYFKSQDEMRQLFHDLPEAFTTLDEIFNKVESYKLTSELLLPKFEIPENFKTQDEYLQYLTFEGAKRKYEHLSPELSDRLNFELSTIQNAGYSGYFLIVQDFIAHARSLGVYVGPGRGSAAGSAVAYCLGITNVDPIVYNLLFERFLNPDRVSMPDIDIDFDDEGRQKVLDYVIHKYSYNQVAQIITYGTMAAKSAIRDCARVMDLPLNEADRLAKLIPETPKITLRTAIADSAELTMVKEGVDLKAQVLNQALLLEGSLRNIGIHACGVVITPDDLMQSLPVLKAKDSDMLVTQFDNSSVEKAGLLKFDFLALTTLSIIKTALTNIKKRLNVGIDIDAIPLDDIKTFQLYQHGDTIGTFQFESTGMQTYLRQLQPDRIEDLIAMNALYRPGPIAYIPQFIRRKRGQEPIQFDLPEVEEYLKETYGITVYQEQVMLLSQKLANFSKGDADVLRKAMGKKQKDVIKKMEGKFIEGCTANGHPLKVINKIWDDWEKFAEYAFNKSHSTCYSILAYQTAYLKAHYPADYMAAVLTHSQSNQTKVTFFITECSRMGIDVLGPHINESGVYFSVNKEGKIRFGLGAIKGIGEAAVEGIIAEREKGTFASIFDFAMRVNGKTVTKKIYENMALAGAFDCFDYHRKQYVANPVGDVSLTEKLLRYGVRSNTNQGSLFGETSFAQAAPRIENIEPFTDIEKLDFEREMVGVYISGHPLDQYKLELETLCNSAVNELNTPEKCKDRKVISIGCVVAAVEKRQTQKGQHFGKMTIEDYSGKYVITMWSEDFTKYSNFFIPGLHIYLEGAMRENRFRPGEFEFKVTQIELLENIGQKRISKITFRTNIDQVNEKLIAALDELFTQSKGQANFVMQIIDDKKISELLSRKITIAPNHETVKALSPFGEVGVTTATSALSWVSNKKEFKPIQEEAISTTFVLETEED